jgi:hypothetical protein
MRTLLALAILAGSTAFANAQDPAPLTVPFELLPSRHMVISVKINDKGPYRLVFDTGAPINLLTTKVAKEADVIGKKAAGGIPLFGAIGPHDIKTFQVGDVKAEKVPTLVMDHPTVAAISEAFGPLEGIIGFPFFARYAMTVDYQKKQLTLVPNGYKPADFLQGMMMTLMRATEEAGKPRIVAPAAVWGFAVEKADGDEEAGVTVSDVYAKTPAADGGLKKGDRLLTLDGRWTDSVADVYTATSLVKAGTEVEVVVKRDGKEMKLKIKPAAGA